MGVTQYKQCHCDAPILFQKIGDDCAHLLLLRPGGEPNLLVFQGRQGLRRRHPAHFCQLIQQGGILLDGEKVSDATLAVPAEALQQGVVVKKGKKTYHRFTLA